MDDRLVLSLPAGTEELAPRKRFEVAEREAKLNSISVLPIFIAAWIALLKQMFDPEEVVGSGSGQPRIVSSFASSDEIAHSEGDVSGKADASDADLDAVFKIATSFRAWTGDNSLLRIADDGQIQSPALLPPTSMYNGSTPVAPASIGAGVPSLAQPAGSGAASADPSFISPASGAAPTLGISPPPSSSLPTTNPDVANDNVPADDPVLSGGGSDGAPDEALPGSPVTPWAGEDNEEPGGGSNAFPLPLPPKEEKPKPIQNRAPLVAASVQLGTGLLNESIIVSLGELLTGASDPDGDGLLVESLLASSGTLQQLGPDRWLFIPKPGESGEVVFSYTVSDGHAGVGQTAHLQILHRSRGDISGTSGDDVLIGTPDADVIDAGSGDDTVFGREGDDVIQGGDGNDQLFGEDGDDVLFGGAGNDTISGGRGDDELFGNAGDDHLSGNEGDDVLTGGTGEDLLSGDEGDDRLDGSEGSDFLIGGEGRDVLLGGEGDDSLDGGGGDDLLFGGHGADVLQGGDGHDELFGEEGNDELDGGAGNDLLDGGDGADLLAGGDGDDNLDGGTGNDVLAGEAGHDTLSGGEGEDVLFGGTGQDTLDGGVGDDDLFGQEGADSATGGDGSDYLSGGEDNDTLGGGNGNDVLSGDEGNDSLSGGTGEDVLMGREGDDFLCGEDGDDTLDGGEGNDSVAGGDGADVILFRDGDGDDVYVGGTGSDTLDLSDIVFDTTVNLPDGWVESVGTGRDLVFEIENIHGGRGRDTLVADDAVNIMIGGAGNDTFVFRALKDLVNENGPRDHIMDFQVGDRVDLSRLNKELGDYTTAKLFFSGYLATGFAEVGQVAFRHDSLEGDRVYTIISGNLNDDEDGEFELVLDGAHDLTDRDFVLAEKNDEQHD